MIASHRSNRSKPATQIQTIRQTVAGITLLRLNSVAAPHYPLQATLR
jgi:hypothetical protein